MPNRTGSRHTSAQQPDFSSINAWIFDLDNTLYPADNGVFAQVDARMAAYIADYLDTDIEEAHRLQKLYYREHGTTLSGMMTVYGMEPKPFLDYVHDIDVSFVRPDPALAAALARLPGRRVIYTNGSLAHAQNVLQRLEVAHLFDAIYGIEAAGYVPKPHRAAFEHFLTRDGITPASAAMFEDIVRNLEAAHALGMTTVWVDTGGRWSAEVDGDHSAPPDIARYPHVDYVTVDLPGFLQSVLVADAR